jgi:putative SOS response-associated peptidase YedK
MCGRFSLKTPVEQLAKKFKTSSVPKLASRYNVAPSQEVLAVVNKGGDRELSLLLWGLIPSWSKEPRGIINARAETILEKPSFKESFKRRPCLIPADGFFEWVRPASRIDDCLA